MEEGQPSAGKSIKTEVLWCSSGRRQHQIPTTSVRVGTIDVLPVSLVRDFGVYFDSDVAMRSHVTATVRSVSYTHLTLPTIYSV